MEHNDVSNPFDDLYQYSEIQYDKDEYIKLMVDNSTDLATKLADTKTSLQETSDTAICDLTSLIFSMIGGN